MSERNKVLESIIKGYAESVGHRLAEMPVGTQLAAADSILSVVNVLVEAQTAETGKVYIQNALIGAGTVADAAKSALEMGVNLHKDLGGVSQRIVADLSRLSLTDNTGKVRVKISALSETPEEKAKRIALARTAGRKYCSVVNRLPKEPRYDFRKAVCKVLDMSGNEVLNIKRFVEATPAQINAVQKHCDRYAKYFDL